MQLRIADTFTANLAKLTGDEQKAAQDHGLRLADGPVGARVVVPPARRCEGQELLIGPGESRPPADRPRDRVEPGARSCRSSRRRASLGGAEASGAAPGRPPRPRAPGRPGPSRHLLRHARECAACEARRLTRPALHARPRPPSGSRRGTGFGIPRRLAHGRMASSGRAIGISHMSEPGQRGA